MSKPTSLRVLLAHTLSQLRLRVFLAVLTLLVLTPVLTAVYSITRAGTSANNTAYAVSPTTLNFQARILNASGSLVPDGTYNIEFKIYNASTSTGSSQGSCTGDANCLWTETRTGGNKVQVKNGYFSAYLGDVTSLPTNIWNQQLWLTMNIGGSGAASWDGEMTPRIRLTSVPFAFRATVADSAETLSKNTGSFTGTVDFANLTADRKYIFPDTSLATTASPGTICVFNGAASNCPAASGSAYYIQNDTVLQSAANFNIQARDSGVNGTVAGVFRGAAAGQTVDLLQFQATNGTVLGAVTAAGDLQVASSVDVRSAGTLSVGTTTATAITVGKTGITTTIAGALTVNEAATFNDNVTVAAQKTITLVGGTTAQRPASPTEGMLYFDTSTKQLLVYANGKWQGDRSTATKIVAASNSTQAVKDAADYVVDGTADEAEINAALTAAAGGKVYLAEGTYTASATILVPNNTTLVGAGNGTLIQLADIDVTDNLIENSDQTTGTGVVIRDLSLDGQKSLQTDTAVQHGIYFLNMGSSTPREGGRIDNVTISNFDDTGLLLDTSSNNIVTGSVFRGNGDNGLQISNASSSYNTITGNLAQANTTVGFIIVSGLNNTLTGNTSQNNNGGFELLSAANNNTITGNNSRGNNSYGIYLYGGNRNTISGNVIRGGSTYGIYLFTSSNSNIISANNIYDVGGATANNGIFLDASDSNSITGNLISDSSATTTNYAINISNNTSNTNYLADNNLGGGTINDAATDSIYGGQNNGTSYLIQPGDDFAITGNAASTISTTAGNLTLQAGSGTVTLGSSTALTATGALSITSGGANALSLDAGGAAAVNIGTTNATNITIGHNAGTFAVDSTNFDVSTLGVVTLAGGQAVDLTTQANQNLSIEANGTGAIILNDVVTIAGTTTFSGVATDITTGTNEDLTIDANGTGSTLLNDNVVVASGKYIKLAGGNTGSRPASPTEGMLYFDTDTHQLLQYNGTKWVSDRSTATKIVAASNSSQAVKDAADYVADGTADEVEINAALTAAAGGKVYLAEGTYVASATILIPNNTVLTGAGRGTLIELADLDAAENLIENSDTTTGTGVRIQDLRIDGRNDLNTAGTQYGIYFNGMGGGSGASARQGGTISGVIANNFRDYGVLLNASPNNIITNSRAQGNTAGGIGLSGGSHYNVVTNNSVQGSAYGIVVGAANNTISGNTVQGHTNTGIYLLAGQNNSIVGNTVSGNTSIGIALTAASNSNTVAGNKIYDNGGSGTNNGIYVSVSDFNSITGNNIGDSSATTSNYGINISDTGSDANYLADNYLNGSTINDLADDVPAGSLTIYGGQNNGTSYLIQPGDDFAITGNAASTISTTAGNLTLQAGSGTVTLGSSTALTATGALSITSGGANALSLDAGGAAAVNIGGTNATSIVLGRAGGGTIRVGQNGGTVQIDGTNFDVSTVGVVTLAGGQTNDITTQANQNLTVNANGTGTIVLNDTVTIAGTTTFSGVATDITTGTNEDLTIVADGTGVINLNDAVTVGGTLAVTGAATFSNGTTVQNGTATDDRILMSITSAGSVARFDGTITNADLTAARTWTLPDASGTFITTGNLSQITATGTITSGVWQGTAVADTYVADDITISSSGTVDWTALNNYPAACAAGSAVTQLGDTITCTAFATGNTGSYIQNQNSSAQTTSNFWVSGSGRADTSFIAPSFTSAAALSLSSGSNGDITVDANGTGKLLLNDSVVVAADQTLRLTGGTSVARNAIASPTDGMLFYDTDTKQLMVYTTATGTGKWKADGSGAVLVAASDSSDADKAAADYVASGTADQNTINAALTFADPVGTGRKSGKVYLFAGTYTINGSISVKNNTTLAGAGNKTVITIPNNHPTSLVAITNFDQATGAGVAVRDLTLDGNKANQSGAIGMAGIDFNNMGGGSGVSARQGARVLNVQSNNWYAGATSGCQGGYGICLRSSSNSVLSGNYTAGNTLSGVYINSGSYNNVTGNIAQGNDNFGITLSSSSYNTVSGNTAQGNTLTGFYLSSSSYNTLTGNTANGNGSVGFSFLSSNSNVISGNTSADNGGSTTNLGISLTDSDSNSITGNVITDSSCTTSCVGIRMFDAVSDANYVSNNTLNGSDISDNGTGTILSNNILAGGSVTGTDATRVYNGQSTGATFAIQPADDFTITGSAASTISTTSGNLTLQAAGTLQLSTTSGTAAAAIINNGTSTGEILKLQDNGTDIALFSDTGAIQFKSTLNEGFRVTNASNAQIFNVDTSDRKVAIGTYTAGSILGQLQVVPTNNNRVGINVQSADSGQTAALVNLVGFSAQTGNYIALYNENGSQATPNIMTVSAAGVVTIAGGQSRDITTFSNSTAAGLTVKPGNSTGLNAAGATLTLQGGAATSGNANGGAVTIAGGAGVGTGTQGLVNLATSAFTSAGEQSFASSTSITAGNVDLYSSLPVKAITNTGSVLTVPDPAQNTIGRLLYVAARSGSIDFTLRLNSARTPIDISMKQNSTATLIWNGTDWTAAGASSSTDLQAAYNNTLTSAGGAELVLNAPGGNADGLTIRNNATTPIVGGLLEVQTSTGSNLLTVNNNATEYALNGGAESGSGTSFTNGWTASPNGGTQATVARETGAGNFVTGIASVKVTAGGASTNQGAADQIAVNGTNTALTANLTYTVSFAVKGTSNFSTLDVVYSKDGTNTATTTCATGKTVTQSVWSRITCTFTAPSSGITSGNAIFIRQSDAVSRIFYIDNLSVNVNANTNHAVDGDADSAANIGAGALNWAAVSGSTVTQSTSTIYNTAGSVSVATAATAGRGVYNKLSNNIVPTSGTQYRVSFYARGDGTNTANLAVAYTPDNGTSSVSCLDYNTQTVAASSWTLINCYFTATGAVTDAQIRITQTSGSATTFYVDALTVTLNSNNANNVQVGGANTGGPTTLLTLDRSSSAPIAANNDAYLGSMYYDTTTGRIQCYEADGWGACGSSPDNIITLTPEYPGAVLGGPGNVMGGGNQTAGIGVMTSEFCSNQTGILVAPTSGNICASGEARNFYHWTSPQATEQIYSIYVVYKLPTTFKAFNDSNTIKLTALSDNNTNAIATLQVFRKNAAGTAVTACGNTAQTINSTTNTWQQKPYDAADETTCSFSGGDNIIFKIDMKSKSNGNIYVENLDFVFTNN